ncbi:unnamed protein product, partial [Rotaria socialis]
CSSSFYQQQLAALSPSPPYDNYHQLLVTLEQIRIWFQNRHRLQTLRDSGERSATTQELTAIEQGKIAIDSNE